jgi:hypothetical protein
VNEKPSNEERIAALEKAVPILIQVPDIASKLRAFIEQETDDRLEMCLRIWKGVVELKNFQAVQARLLADSGVFVEESSRQEFLRRVAQIERQCELLEHTLAKASKPDGNDPAAAARET